MLSSNPPTCDVEHGLVAVASVGNVGGNTAENSGINLSHACHLEDPHGQEGVPGDKHNIISTTNLAIPPGRLLLVLYVDVFNCSNSCSLQFMYCMFTWRQRYWAPFCLSPRWCWLQVLRWSDTGSERRLPRPQTWSLGVCETLEELRNKKLNNQSQTLSHSEIFTF